MAEREAAGDRLFTEGVSCPILDSNRLGSNSTKNSGALMLYNEEKA
jgi:hypothetical protein